MSQSNLIKFTAKKFNEIESCSFIVIKILDEQKHYNGFSHKVADEDEKGKNGPIMMGDSKLIFQGKNEQLRATKKE